MRDVLTRQKIGDKKSARVPSDEPRNQTDLSSTKNREFLDKKSASV